MASIPSIESKSTATATSSLSITITKPTGLAEGDLMVAMIAGYDGNATGFRLDTPSGWTQEIEYYDGGTTDGRAYCFSKIADASDVAASNFTFAEGTPGNTCYLMSGALFRITGHYPDDPISIIESDGDGTPTSSPSWTTALTPYTANSLLLFSYSAANANPTSLPTVSAYASTPSATWTEEADIGLDVGGLGNGFAHGIASAEYTGKTEITNRSATLADGGADNWTNYELSLAVIVNGIDDAAGTTTLLSVDTNLFTQNGTSGTSGTAALHTPTTTLPTQSGSGYQPTRWTTTTKS